VSTSSLPSTLFKKNGSVHWRNCAEFYGVRRPTLRAWSKSGAPIFDPIAMDVWRRDRNSERLRKIGAANNRYRGKEEEILRLYQTKKMGLRAIARYFSFRPTTAGVRNILIAHGVYRADQAMTAQAVRSSARRKEIIAREKRNRHQMAVCLWNLRKGTGVETTCRTNGWNPKTIWNVLGRRAAYRRFKVRANRKWPDKRRYGAHYSRVFTRETIFQSVIADLLTVSSVQFIRECRIQSSRTRVDFKLGDGTFLECKVAVNAGQTYEFIGQAFHYKSHASRIILCIPSDVRIREDLYRIIVDMGVLVCTEISLSEVLTGCVIALPAQHIVQAAKVKFVCKCCDSTEKRRHRTNSYCVDCAPLIPQMRFNFLLNRWIRDAERDGRAARYSPSSESLETQSFE